MKENLINETNPINANEANRLNKDFSLLELMKFTLPTVFLMMFSSMYNSVDGYFIANFVGENAFAAAGLTFPWISAVLAIGLMIGTGGSAIIAKQLGENKTQTANRTLSLLTLFTIIVGVGLTILGYIFANDIVKILGATEFLYTDAMIYLKTSMMFTTSTLLQLTSQMFFIADGKPELGLKVGFIGGTVNIILDYIFIIIFDLGIFGAALSTGLGSSIPAIIFISYFIRSKKEGLKFTMPRLDMKIISSTCLNGSSEMVSGLASTITSLVLNITILNIVGESGVAAVGVITTAQYLFQSAFLGFSQGISPILSYNYGANNTYRLKKLLKLSLIINIVAGIGIYFMTLGLAQFITGIFIDPQSPAFEITKSGLNLVAIAFIFQGVNIFSSALFTSLSNGKISALISFSRTFFFYLVFLLILPNFIGVDGIWLSIPFAEVISIFIATLCIYSYRKKYYY